MFTPAMCRLSFLFACVVEGGTLTWMPQWNNLLQNVTDAEAWWQGRLCSTMKHFGVVGHSYCNIPLTKPVKKTSHCSLSTLKAERDKGQELMVQLERERREKFQLEDELQVAAARLRSIELELREEQMQASKLEADLAERFKRMQEQSAKQESELGDHSFKMQLAQQSVMLHQGATFGALVAVVALIRAYIQLWRKMNRVSEESDEKSRCLSKLQKDYDSELSGAIKLDQFPDGLAPDYEISECRGLRTVKIACPRACRSADLRVDVICNGCNIQLTPQGPEPIPWTKKIQFKPSDGLCEFKGATVDGDYLNIEFQRERVYRIRRLSITDITDIEDSNGASSSDGIAREVGSKNQLDPNDGC